jgi:hypothetical protein
MYMGPFTVVKGEEGDTRSSSSPVRARKVGYAGRRTGRDDGLGVTYRAADSSPPPGKRAGPFFFYCD